MHAKPLTWDITLVGHWNRAILVPAGIGKRLFGLTDPKMLEIEVPLDGIEPYRVTYQDVSVRVYSTRLIIDARMPEWGILSRALEVAVRALRDLPETPVTAVGINVRYTVPAGNGELYDALLTPINSLSDIGLVSARFRIERGLKWNGGLLNLSSDMKEDEGQMSLFFNFHKEADDKENHRPLLDWLGQDIQVIKDYVTRIVTATTGVEIGEEHSDG
ncbi:MAG: hypothetical protein ACLFTT_01510 [Candidatus Hydrogenedentota bacterium]